jgi:ATP-binding cassette, subfamily B, bacterial
MPSEFTAHIPYRTDHRTPLRYIWSHIRRHPIWGFGMIFGAFCNAVLAAVVPFALGSAYSGISNGGGIEATYIPILIVIGSQLLRAVLQLMRNYSSETFAQRIERDVRDELYASLLGKSMTFHDSKPVGEIMARVINDVREMNLMMSPGMNLVVGSGMFLIMPFFASFNIHWTLMLTPAVFMVVYVVTQYWFITRLQPIAENLRRSFGTMNARLAEALDGLQVVKGTASEQYEIEQFNHATNTVRDYALQQGKIEANYLPFLWLNLAICVGFLHACLLFLQGVIQPGQIVAYTGLLILFGFPVFTSSRSLALLASGMAGATRILDIINAQTDLDQNIDGYQQPLKGAITFENVSFAYANGKPILHNISFSVAAGQTVAVVGQTGSGKSTLMKLLNRTYDVTEGRVLVDGVDVRDWKLEALRSQISIIEQDIFLFSRPISENIAFGVDQYTQEQIEDAAKRAQAHDFIQQFAEGYQTIVGQRGLTLSGGQRQRLAIARAFMTNPPILVLDDSTSAIDSATEDHIQRAIWAAAKGRTTLLITHRLSQIRWADHIIVIRQGRIVAQGKHEDLLRDSDAYRRIFARYEGTGTDEHHAVLATNKTTDITAD